MLSYAIATRIAQECAEINRAWCRARGTIPEPSDYPAWLGFRPDGCCHLTVDHVLAISHVRFRLAVYGLYT